MMLDSTLLVAIRGPLKTLDLELPGDVTIGELLPLLLELLLEVSSSQRRDLRPVQWENARLYISGLHTPLPLRETLINAGVCNGTELVLHTQERCQPPSSGMMPQQFGRRPVQLGVGTAGIGVTWQPLL